LKRLKRNKPEDQEQQQETPTGGRSSLGAPTGRFAAAAPKL
jgi:hypothetical protein